MTSPARPARRDGPGDDQRAVILLLDWLSGGPRPASEIEELAEKYSIHARTLERARARLGLRLQRFGSGLGVCYVLPADTENSATRGTDLPHEGGFSVK